MLSGNTWLGKTENMSSPWTMRKESKQKQEKEKEEQLMITLRGDEPVDLAEQERVLGLEQFNPG